MVTVRLHFQAPKRWQISLFLLFSLLLLQRRQMSECRVLEDVRCMLVVEHGYGRFSMTETRIVIDRREASLSYRRFDRISSLERGSPYDTDRPTSEIMRT